MIRPFKLQDYPALARIASAAFPEYTASAEEKEFGDTRRDPKCRHGRWLIERDGQAVGYGEYGQRSGAYHPRKFHINVIVEPDSQGRGLGRALYEQVMSALSLFDPLSVRVEIREDMTRSVRFLRNREFVEDMRSFESRLDVAAFDPTPYADAEARVRALGIEFKTLRELQDTPGHWQKHYKMSQELNADVPSAEPRTAVEKTVWQSALLKNPGLLRDAYLFAVKDGEYIGVTMLRSSRSDGDLTTGLTGVKARVPASGDRAGLEGPRCHLGAGKRVSSNQNLERSEQPGDARHQRAAGLRPAAPVAGHGEGAERGNRMTLPIVHLTGTAYEQGVQHGQVH